MEKKAPELIADWLAEEGRMVNWLARKTNSSREAVSLWLNRHRIPTRDNRAKLAEVTGLPVAHEEAWL